MNVFTSIVVPVYLSEKILSTLVKQIHASLSAADMGESFELILVNDASPDSSWEKIDLLAKEHAFVRGVNLRRNFGQHSATMAGLSYARGDVVVIMDDDLQHPPSEIPALVAAIQAGADVCYTRYAGRQHTGWKILGSRFNDWVATVLLKKPRGLYLSSFKALSRDIVQEILKYKGPFTYVDGLILDVTRSIAVVEIPHQTRWEGGSTYSLSRLVSLWLRMATSFSVVPLRVATVLGLGMAVVSALVIMFIVIQKLVHPETAAGWTSLMATMLFVGGVQTFCIGVMGEYLGRAYLQVNGKPQFVVRSTTFL